MYREKNRKYMKLALELAAKAADRTYPNPMVGAVIVRNGRIIGKGYHKRAGGDHAEIAAIKSARSGLAGSEMFVTLEPCDHYGKTPPCTDAIIASGIKKVTLAMADPNPLTGGRGIKKLGEAGISVVTGLCEEEARDINRKYIKYIRTGLPYITVKLAQTLDGKIAARDGSSKWITAEGSRTLVKKMRSDFDAIMVGANTVRKDDPSLLASGHAAEKPRRIIVDSSLGISVRSKLIKTLEEAPLIIGVTGKAPSGKVEKISNMRNVEVIKVRNRGGRVDLKAFLKKVADRGIVNILVEGGGELAGSLLDEGLADEWIFFISPKILGGSNSSVTGRGAASIKYALGLEKVTLERSGEDILIRGRTCLQV